MPRYGNSPGRACGAGEIKRLAAESRQTATEDCSTVVWIPSPPGSRGHPTRPCLTHGERGNPVKVHDGLGCHGRPTVRGAELRGGKKTAKKRRPAAEKEQENVSIVTGPPAAPR